MEYAVITDTSSPLKLGNMATGFGQVFVTFDGHMTYEPLGMEAMNFGVEVFHRGEILILDIDGREVAGRGRKPSKWDVEVETFQVLEEAIECAHEVVRRKVKTE